jgi:hypothetical protein
MEYLPKTWPRHGGTTSEMTGYAARLRENQALLRDWLIHEDLELEVRFRIAGDLEPVFSLLIGSISSLFRYFWTPAFAAFEKASSLGDSPCNKNSFKVCYGTKPAG